MNEKNIISETYKFLKPNKTIRSKFIATNMDEVLCCVKVLTTSILIYEKLVFGGNWPVLVPRALQFYHKRKCFFVLQRICTKFLVSEK